jgi:hypothetical protein
MREVWKKQLKVISYLNLFVEFYAGLDFYND